MQIQQISFGKRNILPINAKNVLSQKTSNIKMSPETQAVLEGSLDRIRRIKEELPRIAREDCDLRRYKMMGDVEVLLNEISRNIHGALGKTYY